MKYQIAIIGGGPAGYTAAEVAGKAGLSVVLFEKRSLGGVCLNEGCIPTKTLLYSAKVYDYAKHASKYAVTVPEASFDLGKIVARKSKVVRKLVLGIKAKLTAHQVNIVTGEATVIDKNTVKCGEEIYECENLLLCTGSDTFIPPIPGVDGVDYWTHRDALDNKEVPASLAIVGGGVIGMEFASFFNSLGVQVIVVEMMDEILGGMDKELSAMLRAEYAKKGIKFLLSTKVVGVAKEENGVTVSYENAEGAGSVTAEKLLMSVGRRPVMKGFGLENLNLELTERKCVKVDEHMQSSVPGVYVCGDLNGVSLLAHTAVREAEVAVHHILGKEDHRTSNQSGKRKYGSMINIISTKRFIFCSASRLVAYQVRISTANTGRTYCFMCIYHDFIIGCFLYRIEIMVVHPLSVMVFSTRDDVAHITTLYRVITIIGHKLVSFVHVSFVVTYRSRSFMMHH